MDPLALVVAGVAAGAILLIVIGLAGNSPVDPVQARLTQLGSMQAKNLEELELQQPIIDRTLRPLMARLSGRMSKMASASFTQTTEKRLAIAGNPGNMRVADWLGIKAIGAAVGGLIFFALFVFPGVISFVPFPVSLIMIPIGVMFGYTIPEFWLGGRVKKRQKAILLQIPDALDLLTISVRAGLGFDGALGKVVEKLKGPLTEEFRRALAEIRVGKPRRDALRDIIPRTEVPALTNFIGAIIQAEQLGVSISKVLQVQSEQLRIERRQRAEEMAAKAPIKMLFPLVGCIFPSLFIVILGPAIILIMINLGSGAGSAASGVASATRGVARNLDRTTVLAERLETAGSLWAKFMGLMGRPSLTVGGRSLAAREQRDPHDVHALPDRRGVRVQAGPRRGAGRPVRAPGTAGVDGAGAARAWRGRGPRAASRDDRRHGDRRRRPGRGPRGPVGRACLRGRGLVVPPARAGRRPTSGAGSARLERTDGHIASTCERVDRRAAGSDSQCGDHPLASFVDWAGPWRVDPGATNSSRAAALRSS